jgi:hypothetical protein
VAAIPLMRTLWKKTRNVLRDTKRGCITAVGLLRCGVWKTKIRLFLIGESRCGVVGVRRRLGLRYVSIRRSFKQYVVIVGVYYAHEKE